MVQIHPSYDIWTDDFVLLNLDKQMPAGADLDLCEILLSSSELLPQNYPHLTTLYKAGGFYVSPSICNSLNTPGWDPRPRLEIRETLMEYCDMRLSSGASGPDDVL